MMQNQDWTLSSSITLASGLALDMFTDETTMQSYVRGAPNEPSNEDKAKFSQIFKNHIVEVKDAGMEWGRVA